MYYDYNFKKMLIYTFIIIIGVLVFVYLFTLYLTSKVEELVHDIFSGEEIDPVDFLETRKIKEGARNGGKYINKFNIPGVYVAINHTKNLYYIGQGQKVFDRIFQLFTGRGNLEVYHDYTNGDDVKFVAYVYNYDSSFSLSEFKEEISQQYQKIYVKYGQKKISHNNSTHQMHKVNSRPKSPIGTSVTSRIKNIKQPYGGYLRISDFIKEEFDDQLLLNETENINASIVGSVVDYLSRVELGANLVNAFDASIKGAKILGLDQEANIRLGKINGLSDESITAACQLVGFDVAYRANPLRFKRDYILLTPDKGTIENIRVMVNRTGTFLTNNGPIVKDGFTFEGGYTDIINQGDGDFLTKDSIIDLKVLKNKPNSKNSLQLLVYYLMGLHSIHSEFKNIKYLCMFNPRINTLFKYEISDIDNETIKIVKEEIIGY